MTNLQTMQEKMQKKFIPHNCQTVSAYWRMATLQLAVSCNIDLLGGSGKELQQLTERLEKPAAGYGTEISSDKRKNLVNSIKPRSSTNIWMNGKVLEEMDQFKYLGATQTKDGTSLKEVTIRLAQVHSAMTELAVLRKNKAINFPIKTELYK